MAEKKPEAPAEEGAEAPKSKKKLIMFIIIGVVVLTLIIGGVVGYLMLKKKPVDEEDPDAADSTEQVDKAKSKKKGKEKDAHAAPTFFKFDKPFTVKLQSTDADNYLQVEVQFKVLDPTQSDHIKGFDAELKHKITLLLLGKTAADLSSSQGVQRLSNEVRDVANNTLGGHSAKGKEKDAGHGAEPKDEADPEAPVQAVLFTTFIIQ
jgi:flagellar FliL protein